MIANGRPVEDDDLHAYVDGHLAPEDRAIVERYLAEHPEAAARIDAWRRGRDSLRQALQSKAREPIPSTLTLANLRRRPPPRPRWALEQMAASIVLALCVGTGAGWWARGSDVEHGLASLSKQAMISERVFTNDPQLISFGTGEEHQLGFAGEEFSRKIRAPDLSKAGYRLLGGHIVPTEQGSACMFVYQSASGARISLFTRLMVDKDINAPMRPVETNGINGFAWAHGGIGYSLISAKPNGTLHDLSNKVRDEMNAST